MINLKAKWANGPYLLWIIMFTVLPLLTVLYYAFTTPSGSFTIDNFGSAFFYFPTLIQSMLLAFIATVVCLIMAFPIAFIISRRSPSTQKFLIMLIMLPMWMNFLLRTYALQELLEDHGVINSVLNTLGLGSIQFMGTGFAVVLGMVYNYLPYMILPLYSIMTKIETQTIEASKDLGANWFNVFVKILLPLALPGIVSGITMVFVPCVSTFVISKMLGGANYYLIGDVIESLFLGNSLNYQAGSATSLILMIIVLVSMIIFSRIDSDKIEEALA